MFVKKEKTANKITIKIIVEFNTHLSCFIAYYLINIYFTNILFITANIQDFNLQTLLDYKLLMQNKITAKIYFVYCNLYLE